MSGSTLGLLAKLEERKTRRPDAGETARLLRSIERRDVSDAGELIRLHEALLFLRAYPHDRAVLRASDRLLQGIGERVKRLARSGADLSALDRPETSGVAGTTITTTYSSEVVRWLADRFPRRVRLDWEGYEGADRLRALFPRFLPLLEEEALEDANVPYLEWLRAAQADPDRDLQWLLGSLKRNVEPESERAERFDSLQVPIAWELGNGPVTRTRMRWRASEPFLHGEPLIARRDVSLAEMIAAPRLPVRKLSRAEGQRVVDLTRGATALRYREYYGFTYADPASVRAVRVGRGVEIFLMGLERERRLPLRAGFAGFIVKNGVPVGYIEGLALFERIEIGFNIYYTFREGESAWIFGRVLRLLNQVYGVTSFSIDPYQLGHANAEAIESGAFWFYRKLGFRPTDPAVTRLLWREERAIGDDSRHRSSPAELRRLVRGNLLFEADAARAGDWDRFHVRNLGLAVQRRMRRSYGGDARRARRGAAGRV
ncbi:MAG: hypothetical protein M3547_14835, partial [Acidobacteriota bacterium]|nr:hypothetical protein [Acidobacteriota bacterium]